MSPLSDHLMSEVCLNKGGRKGVVMVMMMMMMMMMMVKVEIAFAASSRWSLERMTFQSTCEMPS